MNLGQAQEAVKERGFDYLSPNQLTLMLNTGKDTFEDLYEWPWLQVGMAGPTPMTLDDLKLILMVKQPNGEELLGLDLRQAAMGPTDLDRAGTPAYWWIEGDDTLHVWPGDGADVGVVYVRDSPPLVDPDDTPLIPVRYHGLWIDYAVVEAYKDSDNFSAAQALRGDIALRLPDIIGRYETRNRQHSPFMTLRDYSEDD